MIRVVRTVFTLENSGVVWRIAKGAHGLPKDCLLGAFSFVMMLCFYKIN